jgi:hypothetical protein
MQKFNINDLDINEVNIIIAGLMELPGKTVLDLYFKIKDQIDNQIPQQDQQNAPLQAKGPLANKVVQ